MLQKRKSFFLFWVMAFFLVFSACSQEKTESVSDPLTQLFQKPKTNFVANLLQVNTQNEISNIMGSIDLYKRGNVYELKRKITNDEYPLGEVLSIAEFTEENIEKLNSAKIVHKEWKPDEDQEKGYHLKFQLQNISEVLGEDNPEYWELIKKKYYTEDYETVYETEINRYLTLKIDNNEETYVFLDLDEFMANNGKCLQFNKDICNRFYNLSQK